MLDNLRSTRVMCCSRKRATPQPRFNLLLTRPHHPSALHLYHAQLQCRSPQWALSLWCTESLFYCQHTESGTFRLYLLKMAPGLPQFKFFNLSMPAEYVAHVEINRPEKLNAFHDPMWHEIRTIFDYLSSDPEVRAVLISGAGPKAFTAGTRAACFRGLDNLHVFYY